MYRMWYRKIVLGWIFYINLDGCVLEMLIKLDEIHLYIFFIIMDNLLYTFSLEIIINYLWNKSLKYRYLINLLRRIFSLKK
jgi:hypothetical protein